MLRTRRLAVAAFSLGCLFAFGAWLCEGLMWLPLREMAMQLPGMSLFAGRNERIAELLIGNSIGAFSVCFGFVIEYFGRKREIEEELVNTYLSLRKRCFTEIFTKKNAYDSKNDEATEIYEYISGKMYLVHEYIPKYMKNMWKLRDKRPIDKKPKAVDEENVYSLMAQVISSLHRYFLFISFYQSMISETEKVMSFCLEEVNNSSNDESAMRLSIHQYLLYKKSHDAFEKILVSRYPENSKAGCFFLDKFDVYSKIYKINSQLAEKRRAYGFDLAYVIFAERFIVEDEEILYDETDAEINYCADVTDEEVNNEMILWVK